MNSKSQPGRSKEPSDNRRFMMRYAALGTQLLVAIGLAVFIGIKVDKWIHTSPLLTCVLPLLVLFGIFYKLVRETKSRNNEKK